MTSSPSPRPATEEPADTAVDPKQSPPEKPQLSLTQVLASALAAITTTVLLSSFGIAGTIIGAAVASVATVVGNYAYTRSIDRTRAQLLPAVVQIAKPNGVVTRPRGAAAGPGSVTSVARGSADDATRQVSRGSVDTIETATMETGTASPAVGGAEDAAGVPARRPWLRLIDRYGKGRVLAVTALALFVVVMGVVLVVELVIGKPLSDAVRGQEGSGTSISRSAWTSDDGTTDPAQQQSGDEQPAPADDPSDVPSDVPSDDATDGTDAPTPEPSDSPTGDPTEQPTDVPTEQPTDGGTVDPGDGTDGDGAEDPEGGTDEDGATGAAPGGSANEDAGASGPGTAPGGTTSGGTAVEPTPAPTGSSRER
ncbi:hypothetical protein [Cellulosimicrobium arenosum]|uniref:Uncharacterized protein n=1 Tax=Cellulosimicrobium arenosum TaxID=2708133 RepID=A0A927G8Q4_9MICO|nr:hypothetical protein [Cellulosimicrobium arenosum]MBD8079016.1 hypothetical protein [Cellulosimicrobium arenosum]